MVTKYLGVCVCALLMSEISAFQIGSVTPSPALQLRVIFVAPKFQDTVDF